MQQQPTKVRKDKKRIFVTTFFPIDLKILFVSHIESWLNVWEQADFDNLTFADVKPFLGRNRKAAVAALAELAEKHQGIFSQEFRSCVSAANSQNPLFKPATKGRGGGPKGKDGTTTEQLEWAMRNKVSVLALKLNHVLRVMRKTHPTQWPIYFQNFHKVYFVNTYTPFNSTEFPFVIGQALSNHFDLCFGENLYETFVKKRGLTLGQLENRQCLLPQADQDLTEFFAKFQN